MMNEQQITIVGNLTNDPELRFTPSGAAVANFTVAFTPRTFDRARNEWVDGETIFWRAVAWRDLAERVAEDLTRGNRVLVFGRLRAESWQTAEGEKRTVTKIEVDEIGPSMRFANVTVRKAARASGSIGTPAHQEDDPWAGTGILARPEERALRPL